MIRRLDTPFAPPATRMVDRRTLLAGGVVVGGTALGGAAVWALAPGDDPSPVGQVVSSSPAATEAATPSPTLAPGSIATPEQTVETTDSIDPQEILAAASVAELRAYLDAGAFSVSDLVAAALDRIVEMDGGGLRLNAIIELNPDAAAIAEDLDAELADGTIRGPLHGIPVLLKDIIATADDMATTAGSLALEENVVSKDAFLVERLRDGGAVILGKTNLTEWSNFMGASGRSGWSTRGGQTVNPYHLDYSPSGSSSGSAVAVAAGYVPLAFGSETNGSIISPAATCGVVGLKPTVGLVSRAGVIPISFTQDSPGPMGRSVADVAAALSVVAGYDPDDPSNTIAEDTAPTDSDGDGPPQPDTIDYTEALEDDGLDGARIGICRAFFEIDARVVPLVEEAIAAMADAGAEIVDDVYISSLDELAEPYRVLLPEFSWGLSEFLDTYMPDGPIGTIQEIVDFNAENAELQLSVTDQSGLTDALVAAPIDDPGYIETRAYNIELAREQGIDAVMDDLELDALIAPTAPIAADLDGGPDALYGASAQAASIAGYPSLTVPIGFVDGLPVGIHFFGRAFSEATLLRLGHALEQVFGGYVAPEYIRRGEPLPTD